MSATNCPYDGDFCQKKEIRFNTWQKVIIQNNNMAFQINPDLFANCTIDDDKERKKICERYQRYLFITNNVKGSAK